MSTSTTRLAMLSACCLLASGCSLLAPAPDRSRFFTLAVAPEAEVQAEPASEAEAQAGEAERPREASDATAGITYGLGPVTLPAYLDRREVATRVSPTELTYSPTDCWAQPLAANVSSVLLQDLSDLLGTRDRVVAYPWGTAVKVDYQIEVALLRFERDPAGTGHLAAHWSIKDLDDGRELAVKETVLVRPGAPDDTPATAAALSGALRALSAEIAAALRALPPLPRAARGRPRRGS
jgi:uncharacterized protein